MDPSQTIPKQELIDQALAILKNPDEYQKEGMIRNAPFQFQLDIFDVPVDPGCFIRISSKKIRRYISPAVVQYATELLTEKEYKDLKQQKERIVNSDL